MNELKQLAQDKFKALIEGLKSNDGENTAPVDLTLPPALSVFGSLHPLTATRQRFIQIFERIGFNVSSGPEIEDDWHNFTALNFPENHPAREMQDTFFIEKNPDIALRTHTSSVQIRVMETEEPPIRTLSPGRVFRNEAISARAHCIFHQMEGLYVDENVSFADLKQTLYHFVKEMFEKETKIRFRPSYFPFTEPSAEIDISCQICHGDGCNICKHTGWVEIGGSGMVDPNVLENCGIDSKSTQVLHSEWALSVLPCYAMASKTFACLLKTICGFYPNSKPYDSIEKHSNHCRGRGRDYGARNCSNLCHGRF